MNELSKQLFLDHHDTEWAKENLPGMNKLQNTPYSVETAVNTNRLGWTKGKRTRVVQTWPLYEGRFDREYPEDEVETSLEPALSFQDIADALPGNKITITRDNNNDEWIAEDKDNGLWAKSPSLAKALLDLAKAMSKKGVLTKQTEKEKKNGSPIYEASYDGGDKINVRRYDDHACSFPHEFQVDLSLLDDNGFPSDQHSYAAPHAIGDSAWTLTTSVTHLPAAIIECKICSVTFQKTPEDQAVKIKYAFVAPGGQVIKDGDPDDDFNWAWTLNELMEKIKKYRTVRFPKQRENE